MQVSSQPDSGSHTIAQLGDNFVPAIVEPFTNLGRIESLWTVLGQRLFFDWFYGRYYRGFCIWRACARNGRGKKRRKCSVSTTACRSVQKMPSHFGGSRKLRTGVCMYLQACGKLCWEHHVKQISTNLFVDPENLYEPKCWLLGIFTGCGAVEREFANTVMTSHFWSAIAQALSNTLKHKRGFRRAHKEPSEAAMTITAWLIRIVRSSVTQHEANTCWNK